MKVEKNNSVRVFTAPENYNIKKGDIVCFLGGGITNCPNWQDEVINKLSKLEGLDNLVLFNPRQKNFDIKNPNAALDQIKWEHKYLTQCNIFSMYFTGGISDQPICMYELGKYGHDTSKKVVVTAEEGYKRKQDVEIQLTLDNIDYTLDGNTDKHVKEIVKAYTELSNQ